MAPTVPVDFIEHKESKNYWLNKPMGKSRKYSKGQLAGFVPNYRHAVDTMAESEGLGSSGRIDTEVTASEDSCTLKRKCISLNVDGYDSFGVPIEVLSLSKMPKLERKELEFRLQKELEQVRVLQRSLASLSSSAIVLSPSSDIRCCSDSQKRPSLEGSQMPSEGQGRTGKKRGGPPGRSGSRGKKLRVEQSKAPPPGDSSNAMLMEQCKALLKRLMSHKHAWVFNSPVDVVKLKIPDYYTIIKHPMDLGTVKTKLTSGEYSSPLDFAADVNLTFANAMTYNPPGNDVHVMADELNKVFEVRWKTIEKKLPVTTDAAAVHPDVSTFTEKIETSMDTLPPKKSKIASNDVCVKSEPVRQVMSDEDKYKLSNELVEFMGELPESIVEFLKEQCRPDDQTATDEIEVDIDALGDDALFKLRKLLDDYIAEKQKNQGKTELCELEVVNGLGICNSSLQPSKGNESLEGEVDIVGGKDLPVSSVPSVEKPMDAAQKLSKCNTSSTSSSGSGSSGGESNSTSSSGTDVDAAKDAVQQVAANVNAVPQENIDEKKSSDGDSDIGSQPEHMLTQDDKNAQDKLILAEVPQNQEGEIALPERRVSPDKAYRAAILKNRFLDTILKARQKAFEKVEKRDPEKLRMDLEEHERLQKEEKARLQAEAKAAEEARRKAEAEAVAEAKRKREAEREAARQALQQMEKTVDINENSRFMEDLEMLRTAPDEQGPSFLEETSPDLSQNGLGSFKLQGSNNPLELLGLYRKDEDDFEEEVEPPPRVSDPVKDVEEGEID